MFKYPFRIVVIENPNRVILEIHDTSTYKQVKSCLNGILQEYGNKYFIDIEVYALYKGEYCLFKLYRNYICTCETMSSLLGKTRPLIVNIFANSKEKALKRAKIYCEENLKFTPTCISCN